MILRAEVHCEGWMGLLLSRLTVDYVIVLAQSGCHDFNKVCIEAWILERQSEQLTLCNFLSRRSWVQ